MIKTLMKREPVAVAFVARWLVGLSAGWGYDVKPTEAEMVVFGLAALVDLVSTVLSRKRVTPKDAPLKEAA